MLGVRSIAAGLNRQGLLVAVPETTRSIFTVATSTAFADIMTTKGFSPFSTSQDVKTPSVAKGCLMYFGGVCQLPDHDVEGSDAFLDSNPLFMKVSRQKLIVPRTGKDYMAAEGGKSFISNTLLLPHILNANNISAKGLFDEDNVVILKKLGVLAFREVNNVEKDELTDDIKVEGIVGALSWVKKKVLESLGVEVNSLPAEFQKLFGYISDSPVDIEKIVTDVCLLSRESRAILILRIYGILKLLMSRAVVNSKIKFRENDSFDHRVAEALKKYPVNDPNARNILMAQGIIDGLPYTNKVKTYGPEWPTNLLAQHSHLKPLVGKMGGRKVLVRGPLPDGKGLLHLHRNGVAHWMDEELVDLIKQLAIKEGISIPDHTLGDVMDLLQYEYPEFLQVAVALFKAAGLLPNLDLWSLFTGPKFLPN